MRASTLTRVLAGAGAMATFVFGSEEFVYAVRYVVRLLLPLSTVKQSAT